MGIGCKEVCFPGICQWGFLKYMYTAPCCFFVPCKEKECCKNFDNDNCDEDGNRLFYVVSCIGIILYLSNAFMYYIGVLLYSLFFLIGKFFVFISCCECWLKEDYDMDSFKLTKLLNQKKKKKTYR